MASAHQKETASRLHGVNGIILGCTHTPTPSVRVSLTPTPSVRVSWDFLVSMPIQGLSWDAHTLLPFLSFRIPYSP